VIWIFVTRGNKAFLCVHYFLPAWIQGRFICPELGKDPMPSGILYWCRVD